MLNLARILAAVTAVSEGRAPTDTPKTAPEQAVTAVSVVTAENNKDAQHTAPDDQSTGLAAESLSRKKSLDRYNRYNRYTSNDAGSGVSVTKAATDTADTGHRSRCWRVTLTDGTRLVAVRPEGCTKPEMLEACREQFGAARVVNVEAQA